MSLVGSALRTGAEIGVGLGALGLRRLLLPRRAVLSRVGAPGRFVAEAASQVRRDISVGATEIERLSEPLRRNLGPTLDQVEGILPAPARQVASESRRQAGRVVAQAWSVLKASS